MARAIMREFCFRGGRAACVAGLTATLALGAGVPALIGSPEPALAATAATRSELASLQKEVSQAAGTFSEATARAGELNEEVRATADEILRIEQELMPQAQDRAAQAARELYKRHSSNGGALAMLLNAGSFADFLSMTKYLGTVQSANVAALDELHALEVELNEKLTSLGSAKDEADLQLARAQGALETAQSAAAKIQAKANAEDAEEAEIARQAAEQAAQMQAQQNASQNKPASPAPETGQGSQGQPAPQVPPAQNEAVPDNGPTQPETPEPTPPSPPAITWKSGVASYYGIGDGFMGGTTANGETVTETSMGIAMLNVPFGTRVEIRYGGRSVIAYVNDRGPYVHGRVIDMQPAVARALNFLSVGVATVQYRFL